ncbi:MAG: FxDxF family PEP-CTERM protein [Nitrosomonas sp.]|uniref:FxDxF family PEP-CTERM protein n=1 Tax=Nitrosomonas sp. TaxID=42353 RepID=UPI0025EF0D64|nr:FxDxF family PEP-CTERM protein [Nitrosomonas sp.]MBY0475449.1 FxDxF family PEP-CTERM protein [Nitrosomonas sp.]
MTLRKLTLSIIAAGFLTCGGAVQAASYQFGQLLAGNGPTNPYFADLEITDNGSGNWTFTLSALDLNSIFGSSSFIGSMAVDGVKPATISTNVGGGVTAVNLQNGGGPTGIFDFRYDMINPKNDKLTGLESVTWNVGGLGSTALPGFNGEMALHVQGIGSNGDSAWYVATSPVPEPETYAMLLAGLSLIGFMARRRKETAI